MQGIVGSGRAFRRDIIAEGVEAEEQGVQLLCFGCNLGQGCGIAHPMPAADLPNWIRNCQQPVVWCAKARAQWLREDLLAEDHRR